MSAKQSKVTVEEAKEATIQEMVQEMVDNGDVSVESSDAPVQRGLPKTVAMVTDEEKTHLKTLQTSSAKIRYLAAQGYSTDQNKYSGIANYLGLRTQHVRNVLLQPLKKS